jgi:hypothetical protein
MEDSRTYVSVMRAAVNYSAETASREIWFNCEVNVFLLRVCYCWQGGEAVLVNQVFRFKYTTSVDHLQINQQQVSYQLNMSITFSQYS